MMLSLRNSFGSNRETSSFVRDIESLIDFRGYRRMTSEGLSKGALGAATEDLNE